MFPMKFEVSQIEEFQGKRNERKLVSQNNRFSSSRSLRFESFSILCSRSEVSHSPISESSAYKRCESYMLVLNNWSSQLNSSEMATQTKTNCLSLCRHFRRAPAPGPPTANVVYARVYTTYCVLHTYENNFQIIPFLRVPGIVCIQGN